VIDLADEANMAEAVRAAREWIDATDGILNVAGPRASEHIGAYDRAKAFILAALGCGGSDK